MTTFSQRILELRLNAGLTREQFHRETGLSTRSLQRYEYGEREPTLSTLILFARFYKVSLDYLAGLTDETKL